MRRTLGRINPRNAFSFRASSANTVIALDPAYDAFTFAKAEVRASELPELTDDKHC